MKKYKEVKIVYEIEAPSFVEAFNEAYAEAQMDAKRRKMIFTNEITRPLTKYTETELEEVAYYLAPIFLKEEV